MNHAEASPGGGTGAGDRPDIAAGAGEADAVAMETDVTSAEVASFVATLVKTIRATQTYSTNNPVYQRFVVGFRGALGSFWARTPWVRLGVEEVGLRWQDKLIPAGEGRDSLAFLFYKDGIRQVTFRPGFEDEIERFVSVVLRARDANQDGDDLVTLLWEQEFTGFQYTYVDVLAEGVTLPEGTGGGVPLVTSDKIQEDLAEGAAEQDSAPESAAARPGDLASALIRDELDETLHFLDDRERAVLEAEIETEWSRDLRAAVLAALFDRLEDGAPERQNEILEILRQLLPILLSRGEIAPATTILRELDESMARGTLGDGQSAEAARLFDQLSEPAVLEQLIRLMEDGQIEPDGDDLSLYFARLRPVALPLLLREHERIQAPAIRQRLESAMDGLGAQNADAVIALLDVAEDALAGGAARLAGRLRLAQAAPQLVALMERDSPALRRAVVEALASIPSGAGIEALQRALEDEDRDVRVAAARSLGTLRYQPARARFEELMQGRALRDADLTEKIAFFEAYGALATADSIPLLDRLLNGRGFLGRRQPSDLRACAAIALSRITVPAARAALERAANEPDPVVRSAVARAMRGETIQ